MFFFCHTRNISAKNQQANKRNEANRTQTTDTRARIITTKRQKRENTIFGRESARLSHMKCEKSVCDDEKHENKPAAAATL